MKALFTLPLLCLAFTLKAETKASNADQSLEEVAAKRWSEMNSERIAGSANGQPITLSELRQQVAPFVKEIREKSKSDDEFNKIVDDIANETLKSAADRQLVIAEFKNSSGMIPSSYIDAEIEDTIRRDFNGNRNRFIATLRAQGITPLAYRKIVEDRIIFDYMVEQVRRSAKQVGPGKIQEYFTKHQAEFIYKDSVQLRQITITEGAAESVSEVAGKVQALSEALKKPEKLPEFIAKYKIKSLSSKPNPTFAEIAEAVSSDDFASRGGDAGWKNLEDLNERVVAAIRNLKNGEISEPIQFTVEGGKSVWFILKREGFKVAGPATLDDPQILTEVEERVRAESMKQAVATWLAELRAKNHVEIR